MLYNKTNRNRKRATRQYKKNKQQNMNILKQFRNLKYKQFVDVKYKKKHNIQTVQKHFKKYQNIC